MVVSALLLMVSTASAAEVAVLASGATKEVMDEVLPQFEKASGHKVTIIFAGTANIRKRIAAGEVFDLVIVGAPVIDAFAQKGKIIAGTRTDLMKSGVGAAVRAGAPKPDIGSSEAFKKTLLAAKSIGYSTGPSGTYVVSLIERMGIADQVKPKLKQVPSGMRIGTLIESGEAEIGFQQISELIHAPGIQFIGPLPPDLQKITVYSAGIHSGGKEPDAAKALVKSLTGPEAAAAIRRHGMEPG
jgi:molybdate transport system substrate-binding protein